MKYFSLTAIVALIFALFPLSTGAQSFGVESTDEYTVNIVWESATRAPAFYKGKSLHALGAPIKAHAIISNTTTGGVVDPGPFKIVWVYNRKSTGGDTGSKDTFTFTPPPQTVTLLAEVELSGVLVGQSSTVQITSEESEIVLYSYSPLYGIDTANAFGSEHTLREEEFWVYAAPYYMNASLSDIEFRWRVNRQEFTRGIGEVLSVFDRPASTSGVSVISVEADNVQSFFQEASKGVKVIFN